MRLSIGGLAGLLAVTGLWVHTQPSGAAEKAARQAPAIKEGKPAQAAPEPAEAEPAEGPWIATKAFFTPNSQAYDTRRLILPALPDGDAAPLQRFLGLPGLASQKNFEVWSIVATVADPVHTRLSMFLDSQLESIERSFQAAGWDFAGQWMPWMDRIDATDTDIEAQRKQRRLQREQADYPGILIFRSAPEKQESPAAPVSVFPPRVLFVFLVPETPTTGINGRAFFAAMNLANAARLASRKNNQTEYHQIGLMAPSFTGSFSSLTDLLVEWENANPGGIVHKVVYGGSVSGRQYAASFEQGSKHEFHSGIVDSDGYLCTFMQVLARYGISPDKAAFLRENATGFSRSFSSAQTNANPPKNAESQACSVATEPGNVPVYVFPRDIANLRNAYQDAAGTGGKSATEGTPGIGFSIKSESGEDSVPIFSAVQTPLSQNSMVDSITTQFRRDGTRMVFIAATNPLDSLFLTQVVRRNSPETRVLVGSPDVLFVAAAARERLSGTLFLSTYPMFLRGTEWLDRDHAASDRLKFAGPNFQGIFNVGQLLANDLGALFDVPDAQGNNLRLHGYGRLRDDPGYPGLWLLTLTRAGFLPVDFADKNVAQGLLASNPKPHPAPEPLLDDAPPSSWFMTALLVTVAVFISCLMLLACNVFGWLQRPLWLVVTDQFRIRLLALLGACFSLSGLVWVLAFPIWRSVIFAAVQGRFGRLKFAALAAAIVTLGGFFAPFLSLFLLRRKFMERVRSQTQPSEPIAKWRQQDLAYAGIALTLFLIVIAEWAASCWSSANVAYFFRFRALDLFSGASPASPLLILIAAFLGISLIYFKRYTDSGKIRPILALAQVSKWPELNEPKRLGQAIEDAIMAPVHLPLRDWWIRLGICGFFVFICAAILAPGRHIDAFEIAHYNWALLTAVIVLLFCLATGCYDLVRTWANLSRLIDRIDLLSLNAALDRVSKEWTPQPIWAFGRAISNEAVTRQMLQELRQREEALCAEERGTPGPVSHTSAEVAGEQRRQLSTCAFARFIEAGKSSERLASRQLFEEESARIAAAIIQQDLQPLWGTLENGAECEQSKSGKFLEYSRGFVMLGIVRFLIYVVLQVRRIAFCISLDLLMLILFFHSYNPQSPILISRFLAVLFVAVAAILFQVFAGVERNHTLSRIARTNPGELGGAFWMHLLALGGLPFLGLLAHLFPPISDFLFSWVAPNLQAMH